jgi:type III secretion protein J
VIASLVRGFSLRVLGAATVALVFAAGCTVPVAVGLDEQDANRVTAVLGESGIAADKLQDPDAEQKWRIEVLRDDAARAVSTLRDANLPRAKSPGLLDSLGTNSLVPSRAAEHVKLLAGVSGELERTLADVQGVVSARVHLAVPPPDRLTDVTPPPPSASVLLRYRGDRAPLPEGDVQRLIAGAVPGLAPDRVAVVESAVVVPSAPNDLVRLGPFAATRSSASKLKLLLGGAALLNVVLVAFAAALWSRVRDVRRRQPEAGPAPEAR